MYVVSKLLKCSMEQHRFHVFCAELTYSNVQQHRSHVFRAGHAEM